MIRMKLQNCSKKEITREHSAKSIQLVEVDELTPGKYWVFQ